jgi:hypothetical protein
MQQCHPPFRPAHGIFSLLLLYYYTFESGCSGTSLRRAVLLHSSAAGCQKEVNAVNRIYVTHLMSDLFDPGLVAGSGLAGLGGEQFQASEPGAETLTPTCLSLTNVRFRNSAFLMWGLALISIKHVLVAVSPRAP